MAHAPPQKNSLRSHFEKAACAMGLSKKSFHPSESNQIKLLLSTLSGEVHKPIQHICVLFAPWRLMPPSSSSSLPVVKNSGPKFHLKTCKSAREPPRRIAPNCT